MSIELCILASGSGGNSAVVRFASRVMLLDAGIGPRTTMRRLEGTGVSVGDISAICLTHLDRDHFNPTWLATIHRQRIALFCHNGCADVLAAVGVSRALIHPFDGATFEPLPGLQVDPIALAHDEEGSHGFVVDCPGGRIGYATDLGRVPAELIERFDGVDLLALESNYDPQMQRSSGRPLFLQQRIMGGKGHLSNAQAYSAIRQILDRCQGNGRALPGHIVLLHRSRQCNCPKLVQKLFSADERIAPRLTLAHQFQRTEWLRPRHLAAPAGAQLTFAFS